jgi:hypothetical protein
MQDSRRMRWKKSQLHPFRGVRINLEALEGRETPATFTVTTFADTADAKLGDGLALEGAGKTSLRAAIQEGNALGGNHDILIPVDIENPAVITLGQTLDTLVANFKILGPGRTSLKISPGNNNVVRIFTIDKSSISTISGMEISVVAHLAA